MTTPKQRLEDARREEQAAIAREKECAVKLLKRQSILEYLKWQVENLEIDVDWARAKHVEAIAHSVKASRAAREAEREAQAAEGKP